MSKGTKRRISVGIFDHTGGSLGGSQLVAAHLAAVLSRYYAVDLIRGWADYDIQTLAASFDVDLSGVKQRKFEALNDSFGIPGAHSIRQQISRSRLLSGQYDLFIYSGHLVPPFCYAGRGLVYCHFPTESCPTRELASEPRWQHRNRLDRWIRTKAYEALWQIRMNGYDTIMANSSFTAGHIQRRWGRSAEIVYPPVELTFPEAEKQNLVVSIGRFVGSGKKNQLAQISMFREFLTRASGDWRMCLIGACYCLADRAYLTATEAAAAGLPVSFLVNPTRTALCEVLGKAKLFWHTAGLSNDEESDPNAAEHFGIATVEAMRAGCVPVVNASGGQQEIIENGISGYLCNDAHGIVECATSIAADNCRFQVLSERAKQRSMMFTGEAFERRVTQIIFKAGTCHSASPRFQ